MKIVEIDWVDSISSNEVWESTDEPMPPGPCRSIGYLLESAKTYVTIAQSIHTDYVGRRYNNPARLHHEDQDY